MEVQLKIMDIFPVQEFKKGNEELYMTIKTESSELSINLFNSLNQDKPILVKTNFSIIKFGIFKQRDFLGLGEINVSSELQWVQISPNSQSLAAKKRNELKSLSENLRIKIQCVKTRSSLTQRHKKNSFSSPDQKFGKKTKSNYSHLNTVSNISNTAQGKASKSKISSYNFKKFTGSFQGSNSKKLMKQQMNRSEKKIDFKTPLRNLKTESDNNVLSSVKLFPSEILLRLNKNDVDEHIVDKIYESKIKNDEIIDDETTNKSFIEIMGEKAYKESNFLFEEEESFAFDRLKEDFGLMYGDDYLTTITDSTMRLEVELIVEKITELQKEYYTTWKNLNEKKKKFRSIIFEYFEKIKGLMKKKNEILIKKEEIEFREELKKSEGISSGANLQSINKFQNELLIWNKISGKSMKEKSDLQSEDIVKKKCLMMIMKIIFKNKKVKDNLTEKQITDLLNIFEACATARKKKAPTGINEHLQNLKMKLLPLISEPYEDTCSGNVTSQNKTRGNMINNYSNTTSNTISKNSLKISTSNSNQRIIKNHRAHFKNKK